MRLELRFRQSLSYFSKNLSNMDIDCKAELIRFIDLLIADQDNEGEVQAAVARLEDSWSPFAKTLLAFCYRRGICVQKDFERASTLYQIGIVHNITYAIIGLASAIWDRGESENSEVERLLGNAAKQGDILAKILLISFKLDFNEGSISVCESAIDAGLTWWGRPCLANCYFAIRSNKKAVEQLQIAFDSGDLRFASQLEEIFIDGTRVEQNLDQAFKTSRTLNSDDVLTKLDPSKTLTWQKVRLADAYCQKSCKQQNLNKKYGLLIMADAWYRTVPERELMLDLDGKGTNTHMIILWSTVSDGFIDLVERAKAEAAQAPVDEGQALLRRNKKIIEESQAQALRILTFLSRFSAAIKWKLGEYYEKHELNEAGLVKARECFEAAANMTPKYRKVLGDRYRAGDSRAFPSPNVTRAIECYDKSLTDVQAGTDIQAGIAIRYEHAFDVHFLLDLAELFSAEDNKIIPKDLAKATQCYRLLAEANGAAPDCIYKAALWVETSDPTLALRYYRRVLTSKMPLSVITHDETKERKEINEKAQGKITRLESLLLVRSGLIRRTLHAAFNAYSNTTGMPKEIRVLIAEYAVEAPAADAGAAAAATGTAAGLRS